MKSNTRKQHGLILICILGAFFGGCIVIHSGCASLKARYERTVELEQPMSSGLLLTAATEFGDIDIVGEETDKCRLTARIHVQAETEEQAKEIAEKIKVSLVPSPQGIEVVIDKPQQNPRYSSGAALTIHLPMRTNITARTSYGDIQVSAMQGNMKFHTSFGDISVKNVDGTLELHTSYGDIDCSAIHSSKLELNTSFGDVKVNQLESETPLTAKVNTSYGDIDFICPADFGGRVDISTSFGKVRSDKPVTIQGGFGKDRIRGTIGDGAGTITLKTSFGDISLK